MIIPSAPPIFELWSRLRSSESELKMRRSNWIINRVVSRDTTGTIIGTGKVELKAPSAPQLYLQVLSLLRKSKRSLQGRKKQGQSLLKFLSMAGDPIAFSNSLLGPGSFSRVT